MLKWMKSWWSSQNAQANSVLIVGLGNPGPKYEKTRHNIGFLVVQEVGRRYDVRFEKNRQIEGCLAQKTIKDLSLVLLLPQTYMNLSGQSVKACMNKFRVKPSQLVVVVDDIALDFGQIRFREQGSSGGHNGLKSIESFLKTQEYPRLRVGVGAPQKGEDLADYVLENFNQEEQLALPQIINSAADRLQIWMDKELSLSTKSGKF